MATGYSPQQIAAIAKAQVQSALAPQLNDLQGQQINQNIQTAQQGLNAQAAYNALADLMAKRPSQIDATYTDAANRQAAYGKGFSNQFTQNTQAAADQANQLLAQNNSPAHVAAPTGQADVLYALGGYNPASVLNQAGAAFKTAAEQQPIGARQQGVAAFQQALAKQAQDAATYQANRAKILAQAPGLEQSAINSINSQLLAAGKASEPKVFGSASGGYYTRDPATGKVTKIISGSGAKPQIFGSASGGYYAIDPATGKVQQIVGGTGGSGSGGASTHLQSKNVNGHYVTFDPATGTYFIPGTQTPVDPNSFNKPAKVPSATLRQARQMAGGFYKGPDGSTINLSGISSLLSQYNTAYKKHYTVSQVLGNQEALAQLGVTKVSDPQEIYVSLARMGVPAKVAFDIVAGRNKKWGTAARRASYFPGKGSAAQGAAYQPTAYTTSKLNPAQIPQLAQQALQIAAPKYANDANVQALVGRIMQESGGNPLAINNWDSNAAAGHPSKGILQTIDSTFNTYALPGHTDIWNPLDNAIAAVRYMIARYGRIVGPGNGGY